MIAGRFGTGNAFSTAGLVPVIMPMYLARSSAAVFSHLPASLATIISTLAWPPSTRTRSSAPEVPAMGESGLGAGRGLRTWGMFDTGAAATDTSGTLAATTVVGAFSAGFAVGASFTGPSGGLLTTLVFEFVFILIGSADWPQPEVTIASRLRASSVCFNKSRIRHPQLKDHGRRRSEGGPTRSAAAHPRTAQVRSIAATPQCSQTDRPRSS